MKYNEFEVQSGFKAFAQIVLKNKKEKFLIRTKQGDELEVVFDCAFEDDLSSTDLNFNDNVEYNSLSFQIEKVIKNQTNTYSEGHYIIVNYLNMVASYQII